MKKLEKEVFVLNKENEMFLGLVFRLGGGLNYGSKEVRFGVV